MTPALGAVPTFLFEMATNSIGFTNTGASHKSSVSVGNCVSAASPDATFLDPIGTTLRALADAHSAVARDTVVCPKLSAHISL